MDILMIIRVLLDILRLLDWLGWLPAVFEAILSLRDWLEDSFGWLFRWLAPFFDWVASALIAIINSLIGLAVMIAGFFEWLAGTLVAGFNAILSAFGWLGGSLGAFFDWVVALPGEWLGLAWAGVISMLVAIASWLPAAGPNDGAIFAPLAGMGQFTGVITLLSYFIDLPIAVGATLLVLSIELMLIIPRLWEWILKLIPVA